MSGSLKTAWYRLDLSALPRGVVAVEASASAAGLWFGPVASVLEELVEKLPPNSHPEVAFLGDRQTYPLSAVLRGLSSTSAPGTGPTVDIAAQLGRYPVLGPLLWELSRGPVRPLLVLANSPLLDIEDWAVPEVTGRTLVYRLTGTEPMSHPAFREVGPETELGVLVEHLRDPVRGVRVGQGEALAVDWDNDAYRWDDGALVWGPPAAAELTASFLHPEGRVPEAVITRGNGAEHRLALAPVPPPVEARAIPLSPGEGNVLNLWRRGTPYWCGNCSRSHPPGQLWCAGVPAGRGLFPTLRDAPAAMAYVGEARSGEWVLTPVPRGIVPLADGRVLVSRDGAASEYVFDADHWEAFAEDPGAFVPLDGGGFVIRPPRG